MLDKGVTGFFLREFMPPFCLRTVDIILREALHNSRMEFCMSVAMSGNLVDMWHLSCLHDAKPVQHVVFCFCFRIKALRKLCHSLVKKNKEIPPIVHSHWADLNNKNISSSGQKPYPPGNKPISFFGKTAKSFSKAPGDMDLFPGGYDIYVIKNVYIS